jgi:MOSC domain-containing protein YiiM
MPRIISIVCKPANIEQRPPDHYARIAVERATLIDGLGIDGDTKANGKDRQLNVMLAETVEQLQREGFRTAPGELGEQIVIAGLDPGLLGPKVRLRLGEAAVIEVISPRTGCNRFAHIQRQPQETARGKLGVMARVVRGGEIVVGAAVSVDNSDRPAK